MFNSKFTASLFHHNDDMSALISIQKHRKKYTYIKITYAFLSFTKIIYTDSYLQISLSTYIVE